MIAGCCFGRYDSHTCLLAKARGSDGAAERSRARRVQLNTVLLAIMVRWLDVRRVNMRGGSWLIWQAGSFFGEGCGQERTESTISETLSSAAVRVWTLLSASSPDHAWAIYYARHIQHKAATAGARAPMTAIGRTGRLRFLPQQPGSRTRRHAHAPAGAASSSAAGSQQAGRPPRPGMRAAAGRVAQRQPHTPGRPGGRAAEGASSATRTGRPSKNGWQAPGKAHRHQQQARQGRLAGPAAAFAFARRLVGVLSVAG